jgi:FkbM family methyltransferase
MSKILRKLTYTCLPRSAWLAGVCEGYLNYWRGENIGHPDLNGETRFQRFALPTARVCVDVGTNKGDWARAALRVNSNLELHCFEPFAQSFKALGAAAWPATTRLNQLALSDQPGTRTLHLFKNPRLNSLHARAGLAQGEVTREEVSVTTLDDYAKTAGLTEIDFLKVDVEGEELRVLRGGRGLFAARRVRFAQVEYGGTYIDANVLFRDVFKFATEHGYHVYQLHPRGWRHYPSYEPDMENFRMKNFILARELLPCPA